LLNKAEEGDKHAVEALAKQAVQIGRGLGPIISGLSPRVILVAGDITSAWHRFGSIIEKEVAELTLAGAPPLILATHDGDIARLRGAAALVFQRRFVHEPSQPAAHGPRMTQGEPESRQMKTA
jgi:predicted NBD/HSP70 family sugar kinase